MSNAFEDLKVDEGLRLKAYQDHLGVWTIGYGTNLQVLEITKEVAEDWLKRKWEECKLLATHIPGYEFLNEDRRDVIHSMIYQMGYQGTRNFKMMWRAINALDFDEAANQMRDSQWYRDPKTQDRANRMAVRMAEGRW